jgi:hypothetical protein
MNISIKTLARIGGFLYLINIVVGFLSIGYIPGVIDVLGDPMATAHNILAHEGLYRLGLAGHIIILLTNIPLAVIFYDLFKGVSRRVTLLVVFFTLVGTAVEAANLLNAFAPLVFLKNTHLNEIPPGQLQALSYSASQLEGNGFNLALVFFGCYGICIGYLLFRSGFFPRTLGLLMVIGGSCYLVNSFTSFISPAFAHTLFPYIQLPSGLAELFFCLWLLVKGVNKVKWGKRSNNIAL